MSTCIVHVAEKQLMSHSELVILDRPGKHWPAVIDVYLGKEKKLVKLPPKLARSLKSLLLNHPTAKTTSITATKDDDIWESVLGGWRVVEEAFMEESGDGFDYTHVTESLQLPEIGVEMFNAFKDWTIRKKEELEKMAQMYTLPGDNSGAVTCAKVSKTDLREELWTLMGQYHYLGNVRTHKDGEPEEVSDPDEYYGEEHGGELRGAVLPYPEPDLISKGWRVL